MKRQARIIILLTLLASVAPGPVGGAIAAELVVSYFARLSPADHFNSRGERLTEVWQIIRQDRANYHRFGLGDPQDEGDAFFADLANRSALEQLVQDGWRYATMDRAEIHDRIVNHTPTISVGIYREGGFSYAVVCDLTGTVRCLE